MRIKPIENPRVKMKESIKIAELLVLVFLVTVGIVTLICFMASFYSELYESTYGSRIEVLESKNEELMKEIERLEDEISQKDKEIKSLQTSSVSRQRNLEPIISYADTPEPIKSEINIWNFENSDVTNVTNASAEQLNMLIKQILEDRNGYYDEYHPLANIGDTLVQVENDNGISATCILSVFTWESGFCDYESWPDSYRYANNCAGIMDDEDPRYFKNINECILYLGQLLREVYIDHHNLTSLDEIGLKYCESPQWGDRIEETMLNYNNRLNDIINLEEPQ